MEDDNDSSQEEGFFKPAVKIITEEDPQDLPLPPLDHGHANNLIQAARPQDYLPRLLSSHGVFYSLPEECHDSKCGPRRQLFPIRPSKAKKTKYLSLRDKYYKNAAFECVYSRFEPGEEFNSSIFSLRHTSDFSPKDYQTAQTEEEFGCQSKFQSRFESGNLAMAFRVHESSLEEYDLVLQNDTNTRGYNQWFFFSFRNGSSRTVRFNLVNLVKKHSLFEQGVLPVGLSLKQQRGWQHVGRDLDYQKSYITREILTTPPLFKNYYSLSFTVDFPETDDCLFLALNYPYTFTKMTRLLEELSVSPNVLVERQTIAYSISNNPVPLLRIRHKQALEPKPIVVIGRQHPGQTVGSFSLEGFLREAIKDEVLLKNYELLVLPMVNPDGVIYGNFRTNLGGFDLNRQWLEPDRWLQPQVHAIKRLLAGLKDIAFVLDFHGHSKKYNSFIFACSGDPLSAYRLFPFILSKNCQFFSLRDCTFTLTPDKERTARVQLFRQLLRPQVFTVQTSFFGFEEPSAKASWTIPDLLAVGQSAAQTMRFYLLGRKELGAAEKQLKEKEFMFEQWARQKRDDIESESNPSEDELSAKERKERFYEAKAVPRKQSKAKGQKGKKKARKGDESILNLTKVAPAAEEKHTMLFSQSPSSKKNTTGPVIIRKKIESERVIPLNEGKVKPKKVEKSISVIAPKPHKPASARKKHSEAPEAPPAMTLPAEESEKGGRKGREGGDREGGDREKRIQNITSNLFNKPNFYNHFQKQRQTHTSLYRKTHNSLEVETIKRGNTYSGVTVDVLKKLIAAEQDQEEEPRSESKRPRDRNCFVRENKIISSASRIHEQFLKRNFEEEIAHRTEALRNCQRKMNEITFKEPFNEPWDVPRLPPASKPPKFPQIKIEKRGDQFLF